MALMRCITATFIAVLAMGIATEGMARTITHDTGGRITKFQRHFRIAIKANVRYRIKGTCLSACTIYLGLPYVCVYPGRRFRVSWRMAAHDGPPNNKGWQI